MSGILSEPFAQRLGKNSVPAILTIFGATGDLASSYLIPALLDLYSKKLLQEDFQLVCVGRRDFDAKSYYEYILSKSSSAKLPGRQVLDGFFKLLSYYKGDFTDASSFKPLAGILSDREEPSHKCYNRLYYFATGPEHFATIAGILKEAGLLASCTGHERKVRILAEKPFGLDLQSARALNKQLLEFFTEEQIYRIDHYLGKETVQNIMIVRFANRLFEPLWNKDYIDHVEISVLEKDGVGKRGDFYDQTGALKDFVQNHMLQMMALLAMDEPYDLTVENIRNEKIKVLESLTMVGPESAPAELVRGQYEGYAAELGRKSGTETYVALKAYLKLKRWSGVPFYLRTGKKLSKKTAEISIHFKELSRCLFRGCAGNVLTFRIQPEEGVHLQINNKVPGLGMEIYQGDLEFGYGKAFKGELPSAYERLLLDFIEGDQRLFISSGEIEAAWKFVDGIAGGLQGQNLPVYLYNPGSNGPEQAEAFMKKDLREWRTV